LEAFFLCLTVAELKLVAYYAIMKYLLILLLLIASASQATIYRTVDKNGNIIYSDVESDNSKPVTVDVAPGYTPPTIVLPIEEDAKKEEAIIAVPNYTLSITSPVQNQTFQNPESVPVVATILPKLNKERADKLVFKLDGKPVGSPQTPSNTVLTELERGSHILVVSVVDKKGKVLKRSKSILFHVQRHSVINNKK